MKQCNARVQTDKLPRSGDTCAREKSFPSIAISEGRVGVRFFGATELRMPSACYRCIHKRWGVEKIALLLYFMGGRCKMWV